MQALLEFETERELEKEDGGLHARLVDYKYK